MGIELLFNMILISICFAVNSSILMVGADFYATDIQGLRQEGETSLKVFLEMCAEDGVEPRKEYSGEFNLRISPSLHTEIAAKATASGKSLNQWIADMLDQSVRIH